MSQLTSRQEANLKSIFDILDRDGSGSLDIKELRNLLRQYGQHPSEKRLANALKLVDVNKDNRVDFEELKIIFTAVIKSPEKSQKELEKAITTLMKKKGLNEDEKLTKEQFFTMQEGKGLYPMTREDVDEIFEHLGSTAATKEEIANLLHSNTF